MTDENEAPKAAPKKARVPQKATPAPKGKVLKRFIDNDGKKYFKYV